MKIPSYKDSEKILEELRSRFEDMEQLGTVDIVDDYFTTRTVVNQMYAESKVRSWLTLLTRQYNLEGRAFGRLPNSKYGFITTPAEANYLATRTYHLTLGHIKKGSLKMVNVVKQNLLKTTEDDIKLLKPVTDEEAKE